MTGKGRFAVDQLQLGKHVYLKPLRFCSVCSKIINVWYFKLHCMFWWPIKYRFRLFPLSSSLISENIWQMFLEYCSMSSIFPLSAPWLLLPKLKLLKEYILNSTFDCFVLEDDVYGFFFYFIFTATSPFISQ